jgi:ABC-2 type transport system permease protein
MAVIKRHLFQMYKDLAKALDMLYWPLVDIVLWGFTATWFHSTGHDSPELGLMLLSGLVLWQVVWRANIDISLCFLEELWSKNLVNLFSTPLSLAEWSVGMMFLGFIRSLMVFVYAAFLVWLFYAWNVFTLGISLVPFFVLLLVSGWSIGFFIAGFLAYLGQRIQSFVWAVGWFFSIIGAVFYPLHILPLSVQLISKTLPISYVFEGMRYQVATGFMPTWYLLMALGLSIFYFSVSLIFFKYMFNKSRARGLAHLEID